MPSMTRAVIAALILGTALADLSKRFTVSDTPQDTVDPGVISDCTFWVNVETGDTCIAIESYFLLTQAQFVGYNPILGPDCTNLTVGHSYCVEENFGLGPSTATSTSSSSTTTPTSTIPSPTQTGLVSGCTSFYQVVAGDTCESIVATYGTFTLATFYSWNPAVGTSCAYLETGYYVCVGIAGTPTSPLTTTTSTPTSSASTAGPTPTQSGIISTCNDYAESGTNDNCTTFASNHNVSLAQLYAWNSILGYQGQDCSAFSDNEYYCIGVSGPLPAPGPSQAGVTDTCIEYAESQTGGTCTTFATNHNVTLSDLYLWNTVLGTDGANCQTDFWASEWYCIAVAGPPAVIPDEPRQTGIISTCNAYAESASDGSCSAFPGNHGITAAQFYAWNSILGYQGQYCDTEFLTNEYYCVGVSGPLPAPGPVQAGVIDTCIEYAESNPGGTCDLFAANHDITTAELYEWNTVLGTNGANCETDFWASEYYCIAVAG